mmetsp:Transcript_3627/g.7564  ORF Transcript_3627/g.7564 Transcript_3627/m.7564 type:complete len:398 (-) Transcript_3627:225-1418(-)
MSPSIGNTVKVVSALCMLTAPVAGWGNSGVSYSIFGNSLSRDWLYDAKGISIEVHGCLWSYMKSKDDDAGCLEESSEDGTDVWYQMSNCRRAQVAWSVYASDSSQNPSCNSGNYKESFVTVTSVNDFIGYVENLYGFTEDNYGGYYPLCGDQNQNHEGGEGEGGGGGGGRKLGYPEGISCSSDASFQIEQFYDNYCLTRTGAVSDSLDYLNKDMSKLSCLNVYGNNGGRRVEDGNLIQNLIDISESCSSYDSALCKDSAAAEERHTYSGGSSSSGVFARKHAISAGGQTWFTKLKYVSGGLLLLASFVMFTGILFTNRRRRRALMQRKYRQAKRSGRSGRSVDGRSRRSSRSASKARDSASRKSSSRSRRSKSRDPRESPSRSSQKKTTKESEGVLT